MQGDAGQIFEELAFGLAIGDSAPQQCMHWSEHKRDLQLSDSIHVVKADDIKIEAAHTDVLTVSVGASVPPNSTIEVSLDGQAWFTLHLRPELHLPKRHRDRTFYRLRLPDVLTDGGMRPNIAARLIGTGSHTHSLKPLPRSRKARALVLIPAGARYDHDKIRIHNWPMEQIIDQYSNIGDQMVYDSTLKLLDFETVDIANIINFTDKDVDRYNQEYDFAFLRGSNFIHEHMQWERTGELIERLRIPFYAIGVGAQAETRRVITLPPEARRVWSAIADHSGSIGVRGSYTAEVLASNGVGNVDIIGCPSIFRHRKRDLSLDLKPVYDVRNVAFSLRRETSGNYARDIESYISVQKEFMLRLNGESNMTVTLHGEPEEKAFYFRNTKKIEKAVEKFQENGWFDTENEVVMQKIYRNKLFFNTSVQKYDEFIRDQDLAIGYRVHGILPALANGVPGILVNYDERSAELAETLDVPLVSEEQLKGASWRDIYRPELFDVFQKNFSKHYDTMKDYLDRNGVPHRL
jgi:hypothetical protein